MEPVNFKKIVNDYDQSLMRENNFNASRKKIEKIKNFFNQHAEMITVLSMALAGNVKFRDYLLHFSSILSGFFQNYGFDNSSVLENKSKKLDDEVVLLLASFLAFLHIKRMIKINDIKK